MEIILKVNEKGYKDFLNTDINSFIIGLKDFCHNQEFSLSINELPKCVKEIKENNKNVYLNINLFALERDLIKFKKIINKIIFLDIDGFIVSDLGIFNTLKKIGIANKVTLDLQTYVTNKYSAQSLLNLGAKRVCLAKEITLDDIIEISTFNNGNVEILAQGFYPITYSKRPILKCYYDNLKLKDNSNSLHYIKEENRESYYMLKEDKKNLSVFYDKEYSIFNYLKILIDNKVTHFRIDTSYLKEETIKEYIIFYSKAINYIASNNFKEYEKLCKEFNSKYTFETPFMQNKSFLLKEEK